LRTGVGAGGLYNAVLAGWRPLGWVKRLGLVGMAEATALPKPGCEKRPRSSRPVPVEVGFPTPAVELLPAFERLRVKLQNFPQMGKKIRCAVISGIKMEFVFDAFGLEFLV